MFLAHFSNTPLNEILNMDTNEIRNWYEVAVKLHNHLNKTEDG